MRYLAVALLGVAIVGCGVSKDLYRAQVTRAQELEARAADLAARLQGETGRREATEAALGERRVEVEGLRKSLAEGEARGADLGARLAAAGEREAALRADVDLCKRDRAAAEAARGEERERLRGEVAACQGKVTGAEGRVAEAQARIADLEKTVVALKEKAARVEAEKREKVDEVSRNYEGLLTGMKAEIDRGRVTISQLQGKLSVNVLDEILFDSGRADVKPEGREVLARLGEVLKGMEDQAVVIEGNTDDVAIVGELAKRFPTNWELSATRATSVVRYLEEVVGVPGARLAAVGMGSHRPVAPNDTPEGRARNRRIEIKLVPLEAPAAGTPGGAGGAKAP